MAAALLMMNMHGAVCASDRDRTIFRYNDKIPFAVMVDPRSELPWEEIFMEFQARKSLSNEKKLKENAKIFSNYLTDVLIEKDETTQNKEIDKKIICVGYDPDNMFPRAISLWINRGKNGITIINDIYEISEDYPERHLHLGNCPNIQILFGGMSEDIFENLEDFIIKKLGDVAGDKEKATKIIKNFKKEYSIELNRIKNDPQVINSISHFTVKDMVYMAENLIETEGLQNSDGTAISPVREIGVVTLAEGFVWIKHSLYGA